MAPVAHQHCGPCYWALSDLQIALKALNHYQHSIIPTWCCSRCNCRISWQQCFEDTDKFPIMKANEPFIPRQIMKAILLKKKRKEFVFITSSTQCSYWHFFVSITNHQQLSIRTWGMLFLLQWEIIQIIRLKGKETLGVQCVLNFSEENYVTLCVIWCNDCFFFLKG